MRDEPDEYDATHGHHLKERLVPADDKHARRSRFRAGVRRWRGPIVAIVVAAIGASAFAPRLLYGPIVEAHPVIKGEFVQSVVASGHVEAPFRVNVGAQITGVVADVPVDEGQTVKEGDVLVVLDDREARSAVVLAEGALAQANARMRQLRELTRPSSEEALKQAKATLLNAQQAYDRAKRLAATGAGTQAVLDEATRTLNVAQAQLRAAEFQVYTSSPGGSDYVMAETQVRQAAAALTTAQSRLSYTVINAPRNGVLISRNVERGNVVKPTDVLMVLSPFVDTQIVVQADEKNLGLIAVGQHALVSADAFPKTTFPAEVFYINPGVDLQRASVEVKLKVPDPPAYLRQDMTVSVDIETARRPGVLSLPSATIRGLTTANPWVLAIDRGVAVRRPVKIGLVTTGKVEVFDGVKEGDLVIDPLSAVNEGARVRGKAMPAGLAP